MIGVGEALDERGADQTGSAGDENVHVVVVVVVVVDAGAVDAGAVDAGAVVVVVVVAVGAGGGGQGQRPADHGRECVRVGQVGTVSRAGEFDEFRAGRVLDEPRHRLSMPGGRLLTPGVQRGDGHRRDVEGSLGDANGIELGQEGGPVGPTFGPALLGEPIPGRVTHHPPKEALGAPGVALDRIVGARLLCGPGRPQIQPRHRRFVDADTADGSAVPITECRAECHVTAVAVADHHCRPSADDLQRGRRRARRVWC